MTQADFSESIGIKQATLSQVESGKIQPSLNLLQEINKKHQVSYKYLIDGKREQATYHQNIGKTNIYDVKQNITLLRILYQRIIDAYLLNGKISGDNAESKLSGNIDKFSIINNTYTNDLFFTETGSDMYKLDKKPINLNTLNEEELLSYSQKLQSDVSYFLNTFFELFRDFYNPYMKDS